jgi:hypothetical protein
MVFFSLPPANFSQNRRYGTNVLRHPVFCYLIQKAANYPHVQKTTLNAHMSGLVSKKVLILFYVWRALV